MTNKEKRKVLEDILSDIHRNPDFFEDVLDHSGMSERTIMQLYMIYKFKFNLGTELNRDPGYDLTMEQWSKRALDKRFGDIYSNGRTVKQIYKALEPCMKCEHGTYNNCGRKCEKDK